MLGLSQMVDAQTSTKVEGAYSAYVSACLLSHVCHGFVEGHDT
jgi:hypothetical protein